MTLRILAYLLTAVSAVGGLAVCYLGITLSKLFIHGLPRTLDWIAASVVTGFSLLYLAHPVLAFWLMQANYWVWCLLFDVACIILSAIACFVLIMGVSTAARP